MEDAPSFNPVLIAGHSGLRIQIAWKVLCAANRVVPVAGISDTQQQLECGLRFELFFLVFVELVLFFGTLAISDSTSTCMTCSGFGGSVIGDMRFE